MNPSVKSKLEDFFKKYRLIKYKKNEVVYRPGDTPEHIAYIKSGYIRLYILTEDGKELTIHLLRPFFYFTLNFAFSNIENKYYFETISPVEIWQAPKQDIINFIRNDPEIMMEIIKNLLEDSSDLLTNIEYIITGTAKTKVASMLYLLAQRFGKKEGDLIRIEVTPTHQDIAGLLGMTRETVSIQMTELTKMKAIAKKGKHINILDMSKLKEILYIE